MSSAAASFMSEIQDSDIEVQPDDLVQAIAFNTYGDRCAIGSVDGKIRTFNRQSDGIWHLCDIWIAHPGEVLELQWLPATVYPNLIGSLGLEGCFRIWAEDPSAGPGHRFCAARSGGPVFDDRSSRAPYRSFSMKHNEETHQTYLALLASDGHLMIYESEEPDNLFEFACIDEFSICSKPALGEEISFKVRFDPNPEPCYTALRAGVPVDSLGMVVVGMDTVRVYRSRDIPFTSYGVTQLQKEFYLATELEGHRGLVRDVAWAPGNFRGHDVIATACQDGFARVFRLDTPFDPNDGKSWSTKDLIKPRRMPRYSPGSDDDSPGSSDSGQDGGSDDAASIKTVRLVTQPSSALSEGLAKSDTSSETREWTGQEGQIPHTYREITRLDTHRTPVWRVGFDDDGKILGTTGDDGKLVLYRQTPDGIWTQSTELVMTRDMTANTITSP
ncbi:hypothetical protein E4U59_002224 [Claviceps monticola]|nr:hypothetical protein E4U59_002224 [Claviceps monticola]